MDFSSALTGGAVTSAVWLLKYSLREVRTRVSQNATIRVKEIEVEAGDKANLWERINRLEGRIESLERDRLEALEKLACKEIEIIRLKGLLHDRNLYIAELEKEHLKLSAQRITVEVPR